MLKQDRVLNRPCKRGATPAALSALVICALVLVGPSHAQTSGSTSLKVTNHQSAPVTVGLVLAALGPANSACNPSHPPVKITEIPFCEAGTIIKGAGGFAGKCKFTLKPGDGNSITFPPFPGKCLNGALAFGDWPHCETPDFPTGLNQAEFNINVRPGFQESVDISLVNGMNEYIAIDFEGQNWNDGAGGNAIQHIANKALNHNKGVPGVYPNGCTVCTSQVNPPCPAINKGGVCQSEAICNIVRYGSGGTVEVLLLPDQLVSSIVN